MCSSGGGIGILPMISCETPFAEGGMTIGKMPMPRFSFD
jgi:hypothetical protein